MKIAIRLLCLLTVIGVFSVRSFGQSNICLHLKSGEKIIMNFEDSPVMSFDDKHALTINDAKKSVTTHAFDKLHKVTFNESAGISDVTKDSNGEIIRVSPVDLSLVGFKEGTEVTVISTNGVVVLSGTVENEKSFDISFEGYAKGVYIVAAGDATYKIAIK